MMSNLKLVVASRNKDKVREIKAILGDLPVEVLSLEDFPEVASVEEDGSTFEENALKKALHVWNHTQMATLADDSGLEVDALDGEPGVRSARYAGDEHDYQKNNEKLLKLLKDVPKSQRKARFVCVAVLVTPRGKIVMHRGEVEGEIVDQPRGAGGFGYDPVFLLPHLGKTVAELDEGTKNKVSHRARALQGIKTFLIGLLPPS